MQLKYMKDGNLMVSLKCLENLNNHVIFPHDVTSIINISISLEVTL